jgi:hypothetical protein
VRLKGFDELHAPFLNERRTRGLVRCSVQEIRGISLVFREMWDITALNPQTLTPQLTYRKLDGCPTFAEAYVGRKRRAKPFKAFERRILKQL